MRLVHHTTTYALKSIIKNEAILPVFDYVWFTTKDDGEVTAGMQMQEEFRARIIVEVPDDMVKRVDDNHHVLPHLDFKVLNMITDTSDWWMSEVPIDKVHFLNAEVIVDGKWVEYKEKV